MTAPRLGTPSPRSEPDSIYALVPGAPVDACRRLAEESVRVARLSYPRISGRSARGLHPVWGAGWYGVGWREPSVWYQERGTRPHTMTRLAGKVVPMWVDDRDGSVRRADPKAKTRVTDDGRRQVLIFRRAARIGQRKTVKRVVGGAEVSVSVPASYPGAPGRIGSRSGGRIALGNVGVRWRHPGLPAAGHLETAVLKVAAAAGLGQPATQTTSRVQ